MTDPHVTPAALADVRSALFLPASNPRAVAKARTLAADLVILDLEDAVPYEAKATARAAAIAAAAEGGFRGLVAARLNAIGAAGHEADVAALRDAAGVDLVVVPKAGEAMACAALATSLRKPIVAMIETPRAILSAMHIASAKGVVGLIAGTNDLAAALRLPPGAPRDSLSLSLQTIVLAARAAGILALDGVWNRLDDAAGFAVDCVAGRRLGFDGKTLIHPAQVAPCNRLFGPDAAEIEEAEALLAAARGGAERFRGRMVETLHVDAARRLLARAAR